MANEQRNLVPLHLTPSAEVLVIDRILAERPTNCGIRSLSIRAIWAMHYEEMREIRHTIYLTVRDYSLKLHFDLQVLSG